MDPADVSPRWRVVEGSPDPFVDFYRAEYPGAKRLAWLLTSGSPDAEDVVQDAFGRLHGRFTELDRPAAYLRRSIVNGVRQRHRGAVRESARLRLVAATDESPIVDEPLLDALAVLPERQRAALVLRYWADLTDDDIAAALGVRRPTVRTLVHRALRHLRQEIER